MSFDVLAYKRRWFARRLGLSVSSNTCIRFSSIVPWVTCFTTRKNLRGYNFISSIAASESILFGSNDQTRRSAQLHVDWRLIFQFFHGWSRAVLWRRITPRELFRSEETNGTGHGVQDSNYFMIFLLLRNNYVKWGEVLSSFNYRAYLLILIL